MKKLALVLLAALAFAIPALAQVPQLPANTVFGRLGIGTGPGQAIPFATLGAQLGNNIQPATPVTKATMQTAIGTACAAGGGTVQIPAGTWAIDTSAGPLVISGTCSVIIQGAGADANTGSTLAASSVANNMFSVTNVGYTAFRDFGISTSVTKNGGTAGIAIDESTSGHPNSFKVIERMRINGHFNSIQIDDAHQFMISDNLMTNFTGNCVTVTQPAAVADLGVGVITGNKCWDVAGTAGADSAILWQGGSGLRIHNNRLLCACQYGIKLLLDQTAQDSGALIITDNLIEIGGLYGLYLNRTAAAQAAGRKSGQLVISGNHFQSLPVGFRNAIAIETSATSPWIDGAVISNNIFQNLVAALLNSAVIRIDDGNGISVTGNLIYNTSPGDGGIRVAGGATNAVVDGNRIIGGTAATRYVVNSTTTLRDLSGITFAALPSPGDGSMLYVTDGSPGNPLTGSGSGSMATRVAGAWQGITAPFSVNMGGTGFLTAAANGILYGNGTSPLQVTAALSGALLNTNAGTSVPSLTRTPILGVAGGVTGTLGFSGATSGTVTVTPQSTAGTATFTLPNASGTPAISVPSPLTLSATTGAATWTGLTAGGVLYAPTTTSVASSALGVTGQVLTSNGTSAPTYQQASKTLLNTLTAANSATLVDTTSLTATYDHYEIEFENIVSATDNTSFGVRVSTDGGSSYLATTYISKVFQAAATPDTATDRVLLSGVATNIQGISNSTSYGLNGRVSIKVPSGAANRKQIYGETYYHSTNATAVQSVQLIGFQNTGNTAINALQFLCGAGNITSGKIRIYGVRTS